MKAAVFATVVLVAATGAMAAPPAADAGPPEQAASASPSAATDVAEDPPQDERKICRTEKATGSLTRRNRICLTAAQWREVQDRTRRGVGELQGSASGGKECVQDPFGGCR